MKEKRAWSWRGVLSFLVEKGFRSGDMGEGLSRINPHSFTAPTPATRGTRVLGF